MMWFSFLPLLFTSAVLSQSVKKCNLVADIAFIIDKSGSMAASGKNRSIIKANRNLHRLKEFISSIIDILPLSEEKTRAVLFTFNSKVMQLNNFSDSSSFNRQEFKEVLSELRFNQTDLRSKTFLGRALKTVDKYYHEKKYPARKNLKNILIILTDGVTNDEVEEYSLERIAPQLVDSRPQGIPYHIILFLYGNWNKTGYSLKLRELTGREDLIFKASNLIKMQKQLPVFTDKVCTIFCEYTPWSPWGPCLGDTCDTGYQIRSRQLLSKPSIQNREECSLLNETSRCSPYISCSVWGRCQSLTSCKGSGTQTRKRRVKGKGLTKSKPTSNGGASMDTGGQFFKLNEVSEKLQLTKKRLTASPRLKGVEDAKKVIDSEISEKNFTTASQFKQVENLTRVIDGETSKKNGTVMNISKVDPILKSVSLDYEVNHTTEKPTQTALLVSKPKKTNNLEKEVIITDRLDIKKNEKAASKPTKVYAITGTCVAAGILASCVGIAVALRKKWLTPASSALETPQVTQSSQNPMYERQSEFKKNKLLHL
jgi:hypothetical protein